MPPTLTTALGLPVKRTKSGRQKRTNLRRRHKPFDIFKRVDMSNGNTTACWTYDGKYDQRGLPDVRVMVSQRMYSARKLIYAQYYNMQYEDVPPLMMVCGTGTCVNPTHCQPKDSPLRT